MMKPEIYLRITRQPVGYLLNFGHKDTLEWKRLILSEFVSPSAPISVPSGSFLWLRLRRAKKGGPSRAQAGLDFSSK